MKVTIDDPLALRRGQKGMDDGLKSVNYIDIRQLVISGVNRDRRWLAYRFRSSTADVHSAEVVLESALKITNEIDTYNDDNCVHAYGYLVGT